MSTAVEYGYLQKLCRQQPHVAKVVELGLHKAVEQCQLATVYDRWDCTFGQHATADHPNYTILQSPPIINYGSWP